MTAHSKPANKVVSLLTKEEAHDAVGIKVIEALATTSFKLLNDLCV